jgi:hypothetical protein
VKRPAKQTRQPVSHVVMPGLEVARSLPRNGETVTAFLRRTEWAKRDAKYGWQFKKGLPTVLEINGEEILRKRWRSTRIAANDNVRFVSYPLGGIGGGLFATSGGLFAAGSASAYALTAVVGIGGDLKINILEN